MTNIPSPNIGGNLGGISIFGQFMEFSRQAQEAIINPAQNPNRTHNLALGRIVCYNFDRLFIFCKKRENL